MEVVTHQTLQNATEKWQCRVLFCNADRNLYNVLTLHLSVWLRTDTPAAPAAAALHLPQCAAEKCWQPQLLSAAAEHLSVALSRS